MVNKKCGDKYEKNSQISSDLLGLLLKTRNSIRLTEDLDRINTPGAIDTLGTDSRSSIHSILSVLLKLLIRRLYLS